MGVGGWVGGWVVGGWEDGRLRAHTCARDFFSCHHMTGIMCIWRYKVIINIGPAGRGGAGGRGAQLVLWKPQLLMYGPKKP